jgi:phosphocarrier protein HPr
MTLTKPAEHSVTDMPAVTKTITIVNRRGLHARAAAKFSKLAAQFACDVDVSRDTMTAPGKSILDLLMLAASQGKEITIACDGADAQNALDALIDLVTRGFDERDDDGT